MLDLLMEQMAPREGVTEKLKAENQLEWVKKMHNIQIRAVEIVNHELIYAYSGKKEQVRPAPFAYLLP